MKNKKLESESQELQKMYEFMMSLYGMCDMVEKIQDKLLKMEQKLEESIFCKREQNGS